MFFVLGILILVPLFILSASLRILIMTPQTNLCGFDIWNLLFYVSSNLITAAAVKYFYTNCQGRTSKDIIDITKIDDEIRFWVNLRQQTSTVNTQPAVQPSTEQPSTEQPSTEEKSEQEATPEEQKKFEEKSEPDTNQLLTTTLEPTTIEEIRKDVETLTMENEQTLTMENEQTLTMENEQSSPGEKSPLRRRSRKDD